MSKNLTRKGLAFGALVALASSVVAGAPANAAGVDNTATLVPATGYASAYAVPAAADATFSLKYTTTNVAGATIKFKVTDPTGKIEPTFDSAGRVLATLADNDVVTLDYATEEVTITNADLAGALATGDLIVWNEDLTVDGFTNGPTKAADSDIAFEVTVSGDDVTFTSNVDLTVSSGTDAEGAINDATPADAKVVREARAADNSYIIDSGQTTSGTASHRTQTVKFESLDGASYTRSATVQGWADDANLLNDAVDTSESLSDPRTIQFVKVSEITATTTLTAPKIGDTTLAAEVTTSPVINGAQLSNFASSIGGGSGADFIRVLFTRQDSTTNWASDAATQSTEDGVWSASATMAVGNADASWSSTTKKLTANGNWGFTAPITGVGTDLDDVTVTAAGVVTVVTAADHKLRTGDKVTFAVHTDDDETGELAGAVTTTAAAVTVTGTKSFTFTSGTTSPTAGTLGTGFNAATGYTVATYSSAPAYLVGRVFAGTHSAQALINTVDADTDADEEYTATGTASTLGTLAAAAADIKFVTTGSATLQGSSQAADDDTRDAYIKAGTLSVPVTATVLDADGVAVGAGRSVAFTIARSAGTIKVNDKTASGTVITDANGQVTFTVTDTLGLAGSTVTINAVAEGVSTAASDISLEWATQAYTLYDLATSEATLGSARTVAAGSSYDLNLLVADQWGSVPADGDYRVRLTGSGVTEGFVNFSAGKATVKVTDTKVSTSIASTVALQKKGTTGVFADVDATAFVLTTTTTDKGALTLGADATALYASVTVDLADLVAAKALVERDTRTSFVAQPVYTNDVVIAGKATNSSTGANLGNSVVTVSGPNSILFSNGAVEKRGSITLVANASGEFAVTLYSTTAQTDSVITVKANGVEKTVKVSFTGIGVGEGTALTVAAPSRVAAASTFQVAAKLADVYGNGVAATAGRVKVTYTGAGIVFGTLPDKTDANGDLSFSALLGSADKGLVTVKVQYDQNGDGDFVDAKDLTTSKSVLVAVSAKITKAATSTAVVKNASGLTIKVVRGTKSKTVTATSNSQKVTLKGGSGSVKVYVNGVKVASK